MKTIPLVLRIVVLASLVGAILSSPWTASAVFIPTDGMPASLVLGQPDFTSNPVATTQTGMDSPNAVAVDPVSHKVFVADYANHRILRFPSVDALANGAAATCYVKASATGANSGLTWVDAFTSLQPALDNPACGEIWVAAGTYKPTGNTDRTASFTLRNGMALYGGFAGHETTLAERNWVAHPTILSGDIGTAGVKGDNSYHVVSGTADATTRLDGFTITGGYANHSETPWQWGGGMYLVNSHLTLRNVVFYDNLAYGGGGLFINDGHPQLVNVVFLENNATVNGGGLHTYGGGSATLTNVTFSGNAVITGNGSGIAIWDTSSASLTNSTLWDVQESPKQEIYLHSATSNVNLSYSLVREYCPAGDTCGDHLLDQDPLFVDAAAGNLRLQLGSPAIDTGNNTAPGLAEVTNDLDGSTRFVNVIPVPDTGLGTSPIVDLGAYEAQAGLPILYVDQSAPGPVHDGSSWNNAFPMLQAALAAADGGQEIWVAGGLYYPGVRREATFQLKDGVALYGGFAGTETDPNQRNWLLHTTILSGDIGSAGVKDDNSCHVVTGSGVNTTALLDGFQITAGNANCDPFNDSFDGGGMYTFGGSPTLANLIFSNNTAEWNGGGLLFVNSNSTLTNVGIFYNTAMWGGGIYNSGGNLKLANVTFSHNTASVVGGGGKGGGLFNIQSTSLTLTKVAFLYNLAVADSSQSVGGGMVNVDALGITLTNTEFYGNSAVIGGGVYNQNSSPTLTNVTFSGNLCPGGAGGAMFNVISSSPRLVNTIMWGNEGSSSIYNDDGNSVPDVTYSNIEWNPQSVYPGLGNINSDPMFVDAANGNLRLQAGSPAIDAGDNAAPGLAGITTDLDGSPRIIGSSVDMGAYEFGSTVYLPVVSR